MGSLLNEIHFDEIDSTSSYLKREQNNLKSFTIVSASFQTNGRGREDRQWISEPNTNLLFSLLLKESNLNHVFKYLSIGAAYAIAKSLEKLGIDNVKIKWPNDVYIDGKKVCGILLEGSLPNYLIIGVGLNVNQTNFPSNLRRPSTSISNVLKKPQILNEIKSVVYQELENVISKIIGNCWDFLNNIEEYDYLKGKKVQAEINNKIEQITVIGISDNCSLKVLCNDRQMMLETGEIQLL